MSWTEGDWIVRREILSNGPWLGVMAMVIEDSPKHLISYILEGSPFDFPQGNWPTPDGKHPWSNRRSWSGHGCLMIQRPNDAYAVWHFWHGSKREFRCWYINLQEPFRRTAIGYDTQDLELDLVVYPDGRWKIKDDELIKSDGKLTFSMSANRSGDSAVRSKFMSYPATLASPS